MLWPSIRNLQLSVSRQSVGRLVSRRWWRFDPSGQSASASRCRHRPPSRANPRSLDRRCSTEAVCAYVFVIITATATHRRGGDELRRKRTHHRRTVGQTDEFTGTNMTTHRRERLAFTCCIHVHIQHYRRALINVDLLLTWWTCRRYYEY